MCRYHGQELAISLAEFEECWNLTGRIFLCNFFQGTIPIDRHSIYFHQYIVIPCSSLKLLRFIFWGQCLDIEFKFLSS
jgi:hypothetical protein